MSSPPHQDPFAQREAAKYEQPIASREFILQCFGRAQGPLLFEQLAESLEYREPREREALQRRLRAMVRDGQLLANRRGRYVVVAQADLVAGAVIAHPDGFGFLRPDAPAGEAGRAGKDLYLSAKQMRTLMHGDRAIVRRAGAESRERPEAKLVEILARGARQLCGRYFQEAGLGFVRPENRRYTQDVLVPPGGEAGARHGDIVTAQITAYPTKQSHALGRITEILGRARDTEMHIALAIRKFELPHAWPAAARRD